MKQKLILVSNRLPITIEKENNNFNFTPSVGGLATGLSSFSKTHESLWFGFPGINAENLTTDDKKIIKDRLINDFKSYPVFLTNNEVKMYYNGFSNKTIWPLFHYFQVYTDYDSETWKYYKLVNEKFFDELIRVVNNGDIIWIHDYQLMLLPKLIKDKFPEARIGFFLHIPFPSYEIFRLLPWRKEILEGILGSDLVGFHTFSYARHFLSSVQRVLGYEHIFNQINTSERSIKVDIFPMGIDYDKFANAPKDSKVKREISIIQRDLKKQKIILSIDRLDYTKGIIQRLESFDLFLTKYPEYIGKVTLIMVAVPSRTKVDRYSNLKNIVDETVGRINGKYSQIGWTPVWYLYRSLPFYNLSALYSMSDVALVTPLRDGMNLVAKEYIASRLNKKGVLIVSEMAGVAEELGEAMSVNPNDKEGIAEAIYTALNMSIEEQQHRIKLMQERLKRNDVFKWASQFIERLQNTKNIQEKLMVRILINEMKDLFLSNYKKSQKRLILLDYDGTLVSFKQKPEDAKPDKDLYKILEDLVSDQNNKVVIISGRDRDTLTHWLSKLNLTLVAEHGAWINRDGKKWEALTDLTTNWKDEIRPLLETYVDRTPRTFIEEKEFSLVWHYRNADIDFASIRQKELKSHLLNIVANLNLGIMEGNKVIEIKSLDINKGKISQKLVGEDNYDFIMAIGDDWTDEDMFATLPEEAYSIKVGLVNSKAKYNLYSNKEVRELLKELTSANK